MSRNQGVLPGRERWGVVGGSNAVLPPTKKEGEAHLFGSCARALIFEKKIARATGFKRLKPVLERKMAEKYFDNQ
jgi:hypothetical protein